jgi:ADP-ribose pyrophosphatase
MTPIEPEETLSREVVFSGRLIQVCKETVRLPSGDVTTREIVVHPEVVAVLATLDDGRLVLVRQYRKAAGRILLEIPAGGVDDGETPDEAVRREMIEETGYRVGRAEHICSFYTSPGFTTEKMHLFRAFDLVPGESTEDTDQIEVVLMTPADAASCVGNEIQDAKTILAILGFALREP